MTSQQHSKHPDWDTLWKKLQDEDLNWSLNYIKSHDINQCRDELGNTLLHQAVQHIDIEAIFQLSDLCIDPNIKNAAGQTALQLGQDTNADCLEYLHHYHLCIDFDKASVEPNGLDALFAAIYRGDATLGDTSGVQDDGNEMNAGGSTVLQCAVMYDRPHLIRELHQRFPNLDPDSAICHNSPALRLAAKRGHSNCIIALCQCFPAIDADYALQLACQRNHTACVPTMRECFPHLTGNEFENFNISALMCASLNNNPECIRALHSHFLDIDPNLQDYNGDTALFGAVRDLDRNCISVLFECFPNIDPNKRDRDGNTALMVAVSEQQGWSHSVTLLATYFPSIDPNMRNKEGQTVLMWAIEKNSDEKCIAALRASFPNVDPNIQDHDGYTALMYAVRLDNPGPIISQLHKFFPNIDPNVQNDDQETALMCIVLSNFCSVESMRQFLDAFPNSDVYLQNAKGDTVFTRAIKQDRVSIVAFLLERFPNFISHTNPTGQTALMLAMQHPSTLPVFLTHLIDKC